MKPSLGAVLDRVHEGFLLGFLSQLGDGACITDRDRRVLYWNPSIELISGYAREEMIGRHCWECATEPAGREGCRLCQNRCLLARALKTRHPLRSVLMLQHKGGERRTIETRAWPMEDRVGRTIGALQVFRDLTGAVASRQRIATLERQAYLDPSTGMPNHRALEVMLNARRAELKRHCRPFGVLFAGVDGYRLVVDRRGEERGEALLRQIGKILAGQVRDYDQIGRWGGAEFMAVLGNLDQAGLDLLARKFRTVVERAGIPTTRRDWRATLSVGATLARRGESTADLVDRARRLMLQSRWMGRNSVTVER